MGIAEAEDFKIGPLHDKAYRVVREAFVDHLENRIRLSSALRGFGVLFEGDVSQREIAGMGAENVSGNLFEGQMSSLLFTSGCLATNAT
jgi:hypothetical protein